MTARFEIVTTDDGTHANTISGHNQPGFTSELYTGPSQRRSARRALCSLARLFYPGHAVRIVGEWLHIENPNGSQGISLPVATRDERTRTGS